MRPLVLIIITAIFFLQWQLEYEISEMLATDIFVSCAYYTNYCSNEKEIFLFYNIYSFISRMLTREQADKKEDLEKVEMAEGEPSCLQ